ncbi:MAG: hypothetical protein JWM11_622, partial [Planctomycetaceae bacterium]|nr:hypothetical protein [Planctomycetaceae bacterium]
MSLYLTLPVLCIGLSGCGGNPAAKESAATVSSPADPTVDSAVQPQPTPGNAAEEFARLEAEVRRIGISATLARLEQQQPCPEQLIAALNHVRSFIDRDPSQLWFQLQARTR